MRAFLIGLLSFDIMTDSVPSLCDTVKTCYEATNGEMTCELGLKVHFSTTLCWLWGKSPDLRQKVSFVKKYVFLESLVQRRSVMAELKTRGGRFCRSKVMQGDIFGRCSTQRGLLSLCPTLFKSEKVNGQRLKNSSFTLVRFLVRYQASPLPVVTTCFQYGGKFIVISLGCNECICFRNSFVLFFSLKYSRL